MPRCGMTPFGPAAVAFSLALVACGAVDAGEWTTSIAVAAALPPEIVEASVGRQLAWLIHLLNTRDGVLETREVEAHYHPSFLAWKPTASVIEASAYLAQKYAPLAIRGVQRAEGEYLDVLGDSAVGSVRVRLWVDGPTRLIRGVLVEPYAVDDIGRTEALVQLRPVADVLQLDLQEGAALARLHMLGLHGAPEAALMFNDVAGANGIAVDLHGVNLVILCKWWLEKRAVSSR